MHVRSTTRHDLDGLTEILQATGLFPPDLLHDLIEPFLSDQAEVDVWLTCESQGRVVGFCYAVPEKLTAGTWNMLAIAVLPSAQGAGAGRALLKHLESALRDRGQRILIADTSGADAYGGTRAFYRKNGYTQEARIRDFWAAGEDKIVFWKSLG